MQSKENFCSVELCSNWSFSRTKGVISVKYFDIKADVILFSSNF